MARVETVLGPISPEGFGPALVHEHVMVDFIGAEKTSRSRWDVDEVVRIMRPFLDAVKEAGVKSFVDCTPNFLGRDVRVLRELSVQPGLNIVTNTGLYKEPYLPKYAWSLAVDQLADLWVSEIENGIEGTGVKAGFIKIAVNEGPLIPVQEKIVRAAARASKRTGAVVAQHTPAGATALQEIDIFKDEGVSANRLIVVHADANLDPAIHVKIAEEGAWVEFDSIGSRPPGYHVALIQTMHDEGYEDRLLLSQDAGWYNVGEPGGGKVRGYTYLVTEFREKLLASGVSAKTWDRLTVANPSRAFSF